MPARARENRTLNLQGTFGDPWGTPTEQRLQRQPRATRSSCTGRLGLSSLLHLQAKGHKIIIAVA